MLEVLKRGGLSGFMKRVKGRLQPKFIKEEYFVYGFNDYSQLFLEPHRDTEENWEFREVRVTDKEEIEELTRIDPWHIWKGHFV